MSHEVCHIRCQTTSESCCHNINITQKLLEQMSEYIAKIISDDMWHELCHSKCQTIWLCWCQVFVWTLKELEISICICTHHISKNMSELSGSFAALWSVWFFSCGCCGDHTKCCGICWSHLGPVTIRLRWCRGAPRPKAKPPLCAIPSALHTRCRRRWTWATWAADLNIRFGTSDFPRWTSRTSRTNLMDSSILP